MASEPSIVDYLNTNIMEKIPESNPFQQPPQTPYYPPSQQPMHVDMNAMGMPHEMNMGNVGGDDGDTKKLEAITSFSQIPDAHIVNVPHNNGKYEQMISFGGKNYPMHKFSAKVIEEIMNGYSQLPTQPQAPPPTPVDDLPITVEDFDNISNHDGDTDELPGVQSTKKKGGVIKLLIPVVLLIIAIILAFNPYTNKLITKMVGEKSSGMIIGGKIAFVGIVAVGAYLFYTLKN